MTTVTYLGPAGTFTEQALWDMARAGEIDPAGESAVNAVPVDSPAAALGAVRRGEADFACVAIESSVDGPVTPTFDALAAGPELQVFRETEVGVVFSILVRPGTTVEQVRTFTTHPVAYPQVKQWVDANLPGVEVHQASSNAAAAHQVAEGTHDACAAPARAGELLGLEALATEVADVRGARTRFLLVGRPGVPTPRTGADRTSVSFTLPNQPGTLMRAMNEFAVRQINLTRIESRPTRELFGLYRFYIDCNGHVDDAQVAAALAALHEYAEDLRYLGSWPVAEGGRRSIMTPPPDISQSIEWVDALKEGRR
ncbi:prephenate dehydratase [Corynebacterium sp. HMSC055G02]|uniref:prephenate dehydratase n=1 Tax=unclassified Corynebacterium TaxID=2624378 RepID=UPI0008A3695A|nr:MULTISPECIES: prephenate dehydratase [unclassified Corynebacterium]MBS5167183.1 prephenate dehydratase [Corynebacterium sp.]OFN51929.1 prephenate dehydratase [Corynebacterium sp. HMSC055G02]